MSLSLPGQPNMLTKNIKWLVYFNPHTHWTRKDSPFSNWSVMNYMPRLRPSMTPMHSSALTTSIIFPGATIKKLRFLPFQLIFLTSQIMTLDPLIVKQVLAQFEHDKLSAERVPPHSWDSKSLFQKCSALVAYYAYHWIYPWSWNIPKWK